LMMMLTLTLHDGKIDVLVLDENKNKI